MRTRWLRLPWRSVALLTGLLLASALRAGAIPEPLPDRPNAIVAADDLLLDGKLAEATAAYQAVVADYAAKEQLTRYERAWYAEALLSLASLVLEPMRSWAHLTDLDPAELDLESWNYKLDSWERSLAYDMAQWLYSVMASRLPLEVVRESKQIFGPWDKPSGKKYVEPGQAISVLEYADRAWIAGNYEGATAQYKALLLPYQAMERGTGDDRISFDDRTQYAGVMLALANSVLWTMSRTAAEPGDHAPDGLSAPYFNPTSVERRRLRGLKNGLVRLAAERQPVEWISFGQTISIERYLSPDRSTLFFFESWRDRNQGHYVQSVKESRAGVNPFRIVFVEIEQKGATGHAVSKDSPVLAQFGIRDPKLPDDGKLWVYTGTNLPAFRAFSPDGTALPANSFVFSHDDLWD